MMVNRATCKGCGNSVDYIVSDGSLQCGECGSKLEFQGKVGCVTGVGTGATPNGELMELIEEWRDRGVVDPYGMTWHPPADELEELIDDE